MAINGSPPEASAVGRVVAVNERGIRFEGAENWSNISKFAVGIVMPAKGDTVRVTFDRSGFIRAIGPADGHSVAGISSASQTTSEITPAPKTAHTALSSQQKDRTITRLAVLKAAAEFAASKPESTSTDVLKIAASWERWVTREDTGGADNAHDLVDAF
jgi:hypothetical protein